MARLTRQQWQSLIAEFESSGLTQAAFCNQHSLNPTYFSLKRRKLFPGEVKSVPAFSQVMLAHPKPMCSTIELQIGRVTIKVNQTTPPDYLAHVIRSLA